MIHLLAADFDDARRVALKFDLRPYQYRYYGTQMTCYGMSLHDRNDIVLVSNGFEYNRECQSIDIEFRAAAIYRGFNNFVTENSALPVQLREAIRRSDR